MLAHQPTLWSFDPPSFDANRLDRPVEDLGDGAWLLHVPQFLSGHDQVFEAMLGSVSWRYEERPMYDRIVAVPRGLARLPRDGEGHPIVTRLADAISTRCARSVRSVSAALYRHGADSVAWHGDRVAHRDDAIVATVSLGDPRRFLLRPVGGRVARRFELGRGDLLIMGGTTQAAWEHAVPKVRRPQGPRIAIMFREGTRLPDQGTLRRARMERGGPEQSGHDPS